MREITTVTKAYKFDELWDRYVLGMDNRTEREG